MLKSFGHDIWIADGSGAVAVAGFNYPTRMAVIRLSNDALFFWSPIPLTDELHEQVSALGSVEHLIAPNTLHHLYLAEWKRAFPHARIHAAPGLQKKHPDLNLDEDLGDTPHPNWVGEIDQIIMRGNAITTELVFFHSKSGTVLFTDLLQHFPANWFSGWRKLVAKLDLMTEQEPSVPRKFRLAFTDRKAARAALDHIMRWPVEKVLMAHGTPITENGHAFLKRAFRWLGRW